MAAVCAHIAKPSGHTCLQQPLCPLIASVMVACHRYVLHCIRVEGIRAWKGGKNNFPKGGCAAQTYYQQPRGYTHIAKMLK